MENHKADLLLEDEATCLQMTMTHFREAIPGPQ